MAISEINRLSKASQGTLATSDTTTKEPFNRSLVSPQKNGASFISSFEGSWAGDYKISFDKEASNPGCSSFGLEGFGDIDFIPYSDRTNAVSYKGQAQVGSPIAFEVVGPTYKSSSLKDVYWDVQSSTVVSTGAYTLRLRPITTTLEAVYGINFSTYDATDLWVLVIRQSETSTRRENGHIFKVATLNSTLQITVFDRSINKNNTGLLTIGEDIKVVFLQQKKSQLLQVPSTSSYVIMPPTRSFNTGLWPTKEQWTTLTGDATRYGVGAVIPIPQPMNLISATVLEGSLGNTEPAAGEFTVVYDDTTTGIFADTSYYINKVARITKVKNLSNDAVIENGEETAVGYFEIKDIDASIPASVVLTLLMQPTMNHTTGVINYGGAYLSVGTASVEFTLHDTVDTLYSNYRADLVESARVKRLLSPVISSSGSMDGQFIPTSSATSSNDCVFTLEQDYTANLLDLGFKAVVFGGSSEVGASIIDSQYYTIDYDGAMVYLHDDVPSYDNYYISCVPVTEDAGQQGYGARIVYEGKDVFCGSIDITGVKTGDGLTVVSSAVDGVDTSLNFPNILASEVPETGVIEINTGSSRVKLKYGSKSALGDDSVVVGDLTYLSSPIDFATALTDGHVCFVRNIYATRESTLQAGSSVRANELSFSGAALVVTKNLDGSITTPAGGFYAQELVGALPVGSEADIGRIHWDADTQTWQVISSPRGGAPDAYEVNLELTRGSITSSKILELTGDDVTVQTTLFKATSLSFLQDSPYQTPDSFGLTIDLNDADSKDTVLGATNDLVGFKAEIAGVTVQTDYDNTATLSGTKLIYSLETDKEESWQPNWQVATFSSNPADIASLKTEMEAQIVEGVGLNADSTQVTLTGKDVSLFPPNYYISSDLMTEVSTNLGTAMTNEVMYLNMEAWQTDAILGDIAVTSFIAGNNVGFSIYRYIDGVKVYLDTSITPNASINNTAIQLKYDGDKPYYEFQGGLMLGLNILELPVCHYANYFIEVLEPTFDANFTQLLFETKLTLRLKLTGSANNTGYFDMYTQSPAYTFTNSNAYPGDYHYVHRIFVARNTYLLDLAVNGYEPQSDASVAIDMGTQHIVSGISYFINLESASSSHKGRWVSLQVEVPEFVVIRSQGDTGTNSVVLAYQIAKAFQEAIYTNKLVKEALHNAGFYPQDNSYTPITNTTVLTQRLWGTALIDYATFVSTAINLISERAILEQDKGKDYCFRWVAPNDSLHPYNIHFDDGIFGLGGGSASENLVCLTTTGLGYGSPSNEDVFANVVVTLAHNTSYDPGPVFGLGEEVSFASAQVLLSFTSDSCGYFNSVAGSAPSVSYSTASDALGFLHFRSAGPLMASHKITKNTTNGIFCDFSLEYGDNTPSTSIRRYYQKTSTSITSTLYENAYPSSLDNNSVATAHTQNHYLDNPYAGFNVNEDISSKAKYGLANWSFDAFSFNSSKLPNFYCFWVKLTNDGENNTYGLTLNHSMDAPKVIDSSITLGDVVYLSLGSKKAAGRVIQKQSTFFRVMARPLNTDKDSAVGTNALVPDDILSLVNTSVDFGFTNTDNISVISGGSTLLYNQGLMRALTTPLALGESTDVGFDGGVGLFGETTAAVLVSGGRVGLLSGIDQPAGLNFAQPIVGAVTQQDRAFETFVEHGVFTDTAYPSDSMGSSAGTVGLLSRGETASKAFHAPATSGVAGLRISGDAQVWVTNPRYLSSNQVKNAFFEYSDIIPTDASATYIGNYPLDINRTGTDTEYFPKTYANSNRQSGLGGAHRPSGMGAVGPDSLMVQSAIVNLGLTIADLKGLSLAIGREIGEVDTNRLMFEGEDQTSLGLALYTIGQSSMLLKTSLPFLRGAYLKLDTLATEDINSVTLWKIIDSPVLCPVDADKEEVRDVGSKSSLHNYGYNSVVKTAQPLSAVVATLRVRVERFANYPTSTSYLGTGLTGSSSFHVNETPAIGDGITKKYSWSIHMHDASVGTANTSTFNPVVLMDVVSHGGHPSSSASDLHGLEINPRALGKSALPASIVPITTDWPANPSTWDDADGAVKLLGIHRLMNSKGQTPSVAFVSIKDDDLSLFSTASMRAQARLVIHSSDRGDRLDELVGLTTNGAFDDRTSGRILAAGHPKRLGLGIVMDGGLGVVSANALRVHGLKGPEDKLGALSVFGYPFGNPLDESLDGDSVVVSSRLNRTEFYGDIVVAGHNSSLVVDDSRSAFGLGARLFEATLAGSTPLNTQSLTAKWLNGDFDGGSLTTILVGSPTLSTSYGFNNLWDYLPTPPSGTDTIFPWTKASMKIKGNGGIVYERGFRPQDGTGSELLASISKGVKSDKGIKGLEIPAIGECLLLPKGPVTLSGKKVAVNPVAPNMNGRSSIRLGSTPTDLPIYEFFNGNTAMAMAGLHSINVGNVLQEHGYVVDDIASFDYTDVREGQQFPFAYQYNNSDLLKEFNTYPFAMLNAPETIPGILSHGYHHSKVTDHADWNNFQVRLMDGMVIEDTTTGTFYTVGDIGRGRGWGTDTYQKPLSMINEMAHATSGLQQDATGTLDFSFNVTPAYETLLTDKWNDFFERFPLRPFSVGSVIGVNGNSNSAEIMYDLTPHFSFGDTSYNGGKLLLQTEDFVATTGFGDRVDNTRVRRPTVGHKMRIVPNVEFVPVLGHRSVTGGIAVPYDKATNYTTYIAEADAILYDFNYDFTREDIGRCVYVCGTREYQLVGWYLVTDVVEDYVLDPNYYAYYMADPETRYAIKVEFGVAVVRKIKHSGEFVRATSTESADAILPLRPLYPELHASLDYETNGTRVTRVIDGSGNLEPTILDMHTPDVFFPHFNKDSANYYDPSPQLDINGVPSVVGESLLSGLVMAITSSDGSTLTYELSKAQLDANLVVALGSDRRLWNTEGLCDYLNDNEFTSGKYIASFLQSEGGLGWDDYDVLTDGAIIEWIPKYYWSSSLTATNSNQGISEQWDGGLSSLDNDYKLSNKTLPNFPIPTADSSKPFVCGLVCRFKKSVIEKFNPAVLIGRGCQFSVSLTFDPQLNGFGGTTDDDYWRSLTSSVVNSTAPAVLDASTSLLYQYTSLSAGPLTSHALFHYNLRGFYSLQGHASELCLSDRDHNSSYYNPVFNHPTVGATTTIEGGTLYFATYTNSVNNNCFRTSSNSVSGYPSFANSAASGLRWVFSAPLLEENVGSYLHLTKQRPYRFNALTHTQFGTLYNSGHTIPSYTWTSGWQRAEDIVSSGSYTAHLDVATDIFRINRCLTTGDILVGGDCETYAVEDIFLYTQGGLTRRGTEISYSPLGIAGNWPDTVTQTLPGIATGSIDYPVMYALQPIARERIVTVNPAMANSNTLFTSSSGFGYAGLVLKEGSSYYNVSKLWYPMGKEDASTLTGLTASTSGLGAYESIYSWTPAGEWWQLASPEFTSVISRDKTPPTLKIDLTEAFTQAVGLGSGINTPYAGRAPRGARLNRLWVNFGLIGEGPESIIPGSIFTQDTFDNFNGSATSAIDLPVNQSSMTFNLVVEIPGSIATNSPVLMTNETGAYGPSTYPTAFLNDSYLYDYTELKNDILKDNTSSIFDFPSAQTSNGSFMGGRLPTGATNHSANGSTLLYSDNTYSSNAPKYKGGTVVVPLYVNREAGDMMPNVMEKFVNHGALKAGSYTAWTAGKVADDPTLSFPNFSTTPDWDMGDGFRGLGAIPNMAQSMFRPFCLFTDSAATNPGPNLYDFLVDFDTQRWVEHPYQPLTVNDIISGWVDTYPESLQLNNQSGDTPLTLSSVPLNINSYSPVVWGGQHFAYRDEFLTNIADGVPDLWKFYSPKDAIALGSSIPRSSRLGGGVLSSFTSNLISTSTVFDVDYPVAIHPAAMTGITVSHSSRDLHNRNTLLSSSQAFTMALTPIGDAFEAPQSVVFGSNGLINDQNIVIAPYYEDSSTSKKRHPDLMRYGRTLTNPDNAGDRRFKVGNWLDEIIKAYGIPAQSGSMLPPGARVYLEVTTPWTKNTDGHFTSASGSWISSVKCSFEVETADGTAWTLDVNKLGDD